MCYDLKTFRCGHFKRTFHSCKCTLHCSGEQRQPSYCTQWFCDKRPYYSDGSCDRDHITNISIGHYFNLETGRRGRYRPGQHLRTLRSHRSNSSTTSTRSSLFAIPSTRLPTELLEHLAIHPDELILDRDPSDPYGLEEESIEERIFGIPANTNPEDYFASIPRSFGPPQGLPHGLRPSDFLHMIARQIRARDGDIQPLASAMEGILRAADIEVRHHPPLHRSTGVRRGGPTGRPVRLNPPPALRASRPARAVVESGATPPVPNPMDIDEDLRAVDEAMRTPPGENSQPSGSQTNTGAGPSGETRSKTNKNSIIPERFRPENLSSKGRKVG
ncbi:hypothetical protein TWF506_009060 [Arthrobotrys conoides]|uniref:Uncharacterized protein n=1 Tax=Arthrobotrys conoides TaxID=74498 RepID=A0AAN8NLZ3_9PEZI